MDTQGNLPPLSERDPNDLLTRHEAAQYLKVSPKTLAQWAWKGGKTLKFFKHGQVVRYQVSDLLSLINQNKMTHTEAA